MHIDGVFDIASLDIDKGKNAADHKGIGKLVEIAVEKSEEEGGDQNGNALAVSDGAVNKHLAEKQLL